MELRQGKSLTTCESGEVCPQYAHLPIQAQIIDSFNEYSLSDYYVPGSEMSDMEPMPLELPVNQRYR